MDQMKKTLYDRLGGIFPISAVVDDFSDHVLTNPIAGKDSPNPQLRQWSNEQLDRLPGLKWMRTLWVADASGGPYTFVATKPGHDQMALENAHREMQITPEQFDAVAGELAASLDRFHVPEQEKNEVLAAFAAHKEEVTEGSRVAGGMRK
jgi:hemoglobin